MFNYSTIHFEVNLFGYMNKAGLSITANGCKMWGLPALSSWPEWASTANLMAAPQCREYHYHSYPSVQYQLWPRNGNYLY